MSDYDCDVIIIIICIECHEYSRLKINTSVLIVPSTSTAVVGILAAIHSMELMSPGRDELVKQVLQYLYIIMLSSAFINSLLVSPTCTCFLDV